MAYKRRRTRGFVKSRRFRKRRRVTGWGGYLKTGMSLAKQVWKLKGLVNSELYKLDSTSAFSATNAGTQIQPLVGIGQGDGDGQRTGNSVFVRSFNSKSYVTWNPAGDPVQSVMVALVMDSQQIGDTAPGWTDVFTSASINSHLNPVTVGRFKVLYRQLIHLDVNRPRVNVPINKPMRHHVRFNGSAGTDIQKGGLYLMWISTTAANHPTVTTDHRICYHDN